MSLLISFSFVFALTESANFKYGFFEVTGFLLAFIILWSVIFANRLSRIIAGITAGAAIISGLCYMAFNDLFYSFGAWFYKVFYWLFYYMQNGGKLVNSYVLALILMLCGIVSIFIYFFTFKKYCFQAILAAGVIIFVIQWMFKLFMSSISFYLFVFTVLVYYLRHIYTKNKSKEPGEYAGVGEFTLYMAPVCLLILLLTLIIPNPKNPIEWKWLDNRVNDVYNMITNRSSYIQFDSFSVAATGFGENNGRLGGRVQLNGIPVLTVDSPNRIYLKGSVRDYYTGHSWVLSDRSAIPYAPPADDFYSDTFEAENGLKLLSEGKTSINDVASYGGARITYQMLRTKAMFFPVKTKSFTPFANDRFKKIYDKNGIMYSMSTLGKGYSYSFANYIPKYNNENFIELLKKSRRGLYQEYFNRLQSEALRDLDRDIDEMSLKFGTGSSATTVDYKTLTALTDDSNRNYARYLQLPETLPERIKALTEEVTKDCKTNYDKVKAIEKYLSANYPYTLETSTVPEYRDFVDYFLFDEKQGYCVYYASAMTIMVRSLGIPARYVEGFVMPARPETEQKYKITNENSHAWVEVYFEGFGWVPFEPTSPFNTLFYQADPSETNYSEAFYLNNDYLEYMMRMGMRDMPDDLPVDLGAVEEKDPYLAYKIAGFAIGGIIAAFILLLIFNYTRIRFRLFRIKKLEPRLCILAMAERYFKILALQNFEINPGETPFEYSKRVHMGFLSDSAVVSSKGPADNENAPVKKEKKSRFVKVMELFVLAKYSQEELTEQNRDFVFGYNDYLSLKTRENMGFLKYFVFRYLLGRF